MWKKIVGAASALLSLGSAMFFVVAVSDLITGNPDTGAGVLAGLAVFFGGLTAMTGWGAYRLLRSSTASDASTTVGAAADTGAARSADAGGPPIDIALEARILAIAAKAGGRVTPAEVAVACAVSLDAASAALDGLVQRGHADLHVTPDGHTVHVVKGFLSAEEKAEAKDVLAVER